MSTRGVLNLVGTAVGGVIGWSETPPPAEPASLRALFSDLGIRVGPAEADLHDAVLAFQQRTGIDEEGEAGPRTVHLLARYAAESRELTRFRSAA
ncbi:peptidoglycan-binding protein [Actinoplanes sp. NPDC051851]|uniref:peptidoglycan-binding protein n=1 Tax=Actinoplanes sp. NPDC051851 TaxID=3154753 RepID=UPI00342241BC